MKPLTYDRLLALPEDALKEAFPHGASMTASGKWVAAERGKADLALSKLLKEKLARLDKPRFPARTASRNIVYDRSTKRWKPGPPRPDQDRGYTENPSRAHDWEPQIGPVDGVDDATLKRFAAEARERFVMGRTVEDMERLLSEREQLRTMLVTYRDLARERGVNVRSDIRVIEGRLAALDRKLGLERVA